MGQAGRLLTAPGHPSPIPCLLSVVSPNLCSPRAAFTLIISNYLFLLSTACGLWRWQHLCASICVLFHSLIQHIPDFYRTPLHIYIFFLESPILKSAVEPCGVNDGGNQGRYRGFSGTHLSKTCWQTQNLAKPWFCFEMIHSLSTGSRKVRKDM